MYLDNDDHLFPGSSKDLESPSLPYSYDDIQEIHFFWIIVIKLSFLSYWCLLSVQYTDSVLFKKGFFNSHYKLKRSVVANNQICRTQESQLKIVYKKKHPQQHYI